MSPEKIAFQGEMQLLSWGDTSTRGRTVTFLLPEEGPEHPFKHAREKKGKTAGARYMAVLVQIGDDEQPVSKTPAQMAFLLCRDETFQFFLSERSFCEINSEETARAHILEVCGIPSRSKLDTDPGARSTWLTAIYNPWTAYQASINNKAVI